MSFNSIFQALRQAGKGIDFFSIPPLLSSTATSLTSTSQGALIASLTDPFAGKGLGTTTYSTFGTVPGQLALSAGAIVGGADEITADQSYSISIAATSGDGSRVIGGTFTFVAQGVDFSSVWAGDDTVPAGNQYFMTRAQALEARFALLGG